MAHNRSKSHPFSDSYQRKENAYRTLYPYGQYSSLSPSSPDVIWTLVPAVASTLKNAILTFKPVKKPPPTHKQSTLTNMVKPQFLFCEHMDKGLLFLATARELVKRFRL
jgi:hypothetical protein